MRALLVETAMCLPGAFAVPSSLKDCTRLCLGCLHGGKERNAYDDIVHSCLGCLHGGKEKNAYDDRKRNTTLRPVQT